MAAPENPLTLGSYFAVAGFDEEQGLANDTYIGDFTQPENISKPPLECSYACKIIAHYPKQRPQNPFSHEISSLCLPKGIKFYTERNLPKEPFFHSFVNVREDGSYVNGVALTFFELVNDIKLCEEMSRLTKDHIQKINVAEVRQQRFSNTTLNGTHSLPRSAYRKQNSNKMYFNSHNPLYISKVICLITQIPIINAAKKFLLAIYKLIKSSQPCVLPVESFIYWVTNEVPLPVAGTALKVHIQGTEMIVRRPSNNDLPFFDYSFTDLFKIMSVDKFVNLYACFMLEHQILFCSKSLTSLMLVAESLCTLAFPFKWQMTYVPILPQSQLKFIEAPVPYVMGFWYEGRVPDQIFQSNVCIFDLDTGRFDHPEDIPDFPQSKTLSNCINDILTTYSFDDHEFSVRENSGDSKPNPHVKMRQNNVRWRNDGTSNNVPHREDWSQKRMSRSFDDFNASMQFKHSHRDLGSSYLHSDFDGSDNEYSDYNHQPNQILNPLHTNAPNVDKNPDEYHKMSEESKEYLHQLKINNIIRELFCHHLTTLFVNYDQFLHHDVNEDSLHNVNNRDSIVSFDKASFLSEQPDSHLLFLAAFLETQMFTSFVDTKIMSQWGGENESFKLFDEKIATLKSRYSAPNNCNNVDESTQPCFDKDEAAKFKFEAFDYIVPAPHYINGTPILKCYNGCFPQLVGDSLEAPIIQSAVNSPWKQRHKRINVAENRFDIDSKSDQDGLRQDTNTFGSDKVVSASVKKVIAQESPSQIAQQNMKFVEQLLKETKNKTKRMLVDKMGREAVDLGHSDVSINGVEENTLVANFCDLLERLWAHGLEKKQSKSAFWNHVLNRQEHDKNLSPAINQYNKTTLSPEMKNVNDINELIANMKNELMSYQQEKQKTKLENTERNRNMAQQDHNLNYTSNEHDDSEDWSKSFIKAANVLFTSASVAYNDLINQSPYESKKPPIHHAPPSTISNQIPTKLGLPRSKSLTRVFNFRLPKGNSMSGFAPTWSTTDNNPDQLQSLSGSHINLASPLKQQNANESRSIHLGSLSSRSLSAHGSRNRSLSRPRSPEFAVHPHQNRLRPLSKDITYDLKNVLRMTELKSDTGFARAFVRLSLERKLLHKHMKIILEDPTLLNKLYKPYAFLLCEDEREQFLYHILSLNAVDFSCFTNTFINSKMQYEVLVVSEIDKLYSGGMWVMLTGSLGSTTNIYLPENTLQFSFDNKNIGILSTLRIGYDITDRTNYPSKWYLENVVVRNNITGQTFLFNCCRWFGKGVDDGSLERLLVAEVIKHHVDEEDPASISHLHSNYSSSTNIHRPESPMNITSKLYNPTSIMSKRKRSSSVGKGSDSFGVKQLLSVTDVQNFLRTTVNGITKYFCNDKGQSGNSKLTQLLCGELGFVYCFEQVFLISRRDSVFYHRFFKQFYAWDFVERVCNWFNDLLKSVSAKQLTKDQKKLITGILKIYNKITANNVIGKEGKFSVFILLALRDHMLLGLLVTMAWTPITQQMYDDNSFLRNKSLLTFLTQLVESLNQFEFVLEKSLIYGIQ